MRKIVQNLWRAVIVVLVAIGTGIAFSHDDFDGVMRFFTNQSNIILGLFMLTTFIKRPNGLYRSEKIFTYVKSAVTLYIVITGMVFAIVLASTMSRIGLESVLLHYIVPPMTAIDFILLDNDTQLKIRPKYLLGVLGYPLVYVICTLARSIWGDGFVPYPFMDPVLGAGGVAMNFVMYMVGFAALYILLVLLHNLFGRVMHRNAV